MEVTTYSIAIQDKNLQRHIVRGLFIRIELMLGKNNIDAHCGLSNSQNPNDKFFTLLYRKALPEFAFNHILELKSPDGIKPVCLEFYAYGQNGDYLSVLTIN